MKKFRFFLTGFTALVWLGSAFAVVGGGEVTIKGGTAGDVRFSHEVHVETAAMGCKECHPKPYLDTKQHKHVTMKEMQKGKSCGACHNGKKAFSVKGDCAKCHKK
ncbi:cytochrome c3 family protein [Geotalea toluenoxydans]|uniref:cytochrome c3 family protein n=1 Tax=Geotalea toluenoxydans TaxID=421624 RepID=UPI0006D18A39|nr:cytochrome c3 family protein [Geotalea toluenoxydans]